MTVSMSAALSGLKIAQQALDTISTNVSNASTPGYTRKILPQETQVVNGTAVGITAGTLTRVVNTTLINDVNKQTATVGYVSVQQSYLQQIQDFHGAPDAGTALSDQVTQLANTFSQLSQSPSDPSMLNQVVVTAQQTATKINNFSNLLTNMRRQTETDISADVGAVNGDLDQIATLNVQISLLSAQGQSTADLEDKRDTAINDVSKYLQVTTTTNGKSITVSTSQGQTLADNTSHKLFFSQNNMLPSNYYPGGGLSGLTIGSPSGMDITQANLGGQLGGLFTLRDQTLPQYGAQIDEFAQKLASRFQDEGLALFTDGNGNVPADVADPATPNYVGFSALIQVNPAIIADPTLIQDGTTGGTQPASSNEVINRISQYAFGNYQYQQAAGTVNISGAAPPLVQRLSLSTNTNVTGTVNLASYAPDLSTLPGATFPGTFDITLGATTHTITVQSTDTAASIVTQVNTAFGSNVASLNSQGQLALNYSGNITLADGGIGLAALGLTAGTTPMPDPTFQVKVGTQAPVTISIAATDTSTQLLAKLNAVPGLTASLDGSGHLVMVPTDGGNLVVTDTGGGALAAMGVTSSNVAFPPFRQGHVGADGTLSTGLLANSSLQNYIVSSIADQSETANLVGSQSDQESSYLTALQTRNSNLSGVDIDQEMADLIRVQSAYSAAAKMITASQSMLQELLNAFPSG